MLYSCTLMATMGIEGLSMEILTDIYLLHLENKFIICGVQLPSLFADFFPICSVVMHSY